MSVLLIGMGGSILTALSGTASRSFDLCFSPFAFVFSPSLKTPRFQALGPVFRPFDHFGVHFDVGGPWAGVAVFERLCWWRRLPFVRPASECLFRDRRY